MLNAVPAALPARDIESLAGLIEQVESVFRGKRETVRLSLAALLARGHLLFEDIPGVGKTTLARALTAALDGCQGAFVMLPTISFSTRGRRIPPSTWRCGRPLYFFASIT